MKQILKYYYQAIENVPILKYSRIFIATIFILALIGILKLKNTDVLLYAVGVIFVSFLTFIFSNLISSKSAPIRIALYLITYSIVITIIFCILSFGWFMLYQKPIFYKRWFPDFTTSTANTNNNIIVPDSSIERTKNTDKKQHLKEPIFEKRDKNLKSQSRIISIQLSQKSNGYSSLFLDGKKLEVLPESTKYNPRIEVRDYVGKGKILIITNTGDSCWTSLSNQNSSTLLRVVPNCL